MMGGRIWVQSDSGKGSTFAFTIKLERGAEKKQELLSSDINWNNVHIMAVDDDPDILLYFIEIAQRFGVYCDTAISGETALALVEKNGDYHIYFVDWKMPGMDGIQLTYRLKSRESENSVVIMISAAEWTTVADEAKKAGVDKFLSKPLFPSSIADIINECLSLDRRQMEEAQTEIEGVFSGRRILLAEDVEINREIVQALLEPSKLEIDCAENGREAVRMFSEAPEKYDMIFMDVQMPEMDGYEATRRIRAMNTQKAKTIPIVAMTANVFREDVERCIEAGMNSHVGKPLDFNEVMKRLRTFLPN
jgi:CheY-like chemotaxis protein